MHGEQNVKKKKDEVFGRFSQFCEGA